MLKTINDYKAEIKRIELALNKTTSQHLINDYTKYLARLKREVADYYKFNGGKQ